MVGGRSRPARHIRPFRAARSSDVLLLSSSLGPLGHTIAAGLGLPSIGVYLQPLAATGEFAPPVTSTRSWGPLGNRLPDRLRAFLSAGPPPVFVGPGSATVPDPEQLSRTVVRALRTAGLRGVIQRGWSQLASEGDDMLTIDEVPHHLLFPHLAAAVHHAGAGTTAAALRAGIPTVPLPVRFGAAFWGARLTALGVAPTAIPLCRLTAEALTARLSSRPRPTRPTSAAPRPWPPASARRTAPARSWPR